MKNFPRRKLCEMITQYGVSLCDDPVRCEGLLRDYCGKHKKEIFILISALAERIPIDLLNFNGKVPIELRMVQLTERLRVNLSFNKSAAKWGTESWALALGVISISDLGRQISNGKTASRLNPQSVRENNLYSMSEAKNSLGAQADQMQDNFNSRRARVNSPNNVRRVGVMLLMMYIGLVVGWLLSKFC